MKKIYLLRVIAVIVLLAIAVSCFAACDKRDDTPPDTRTSGKLLGDNIVKLLESVNDLFVGLENNQVNLEVSANLSLKNNGETSNFAFLLQTALDLKNSTNNTSAANLAISENGSNLFKLNLQDDKLYLNSEDSGKVVVDLFNIPALIKHFDPTYEGIDLGEFDFKGTVVDALAQIDLAALVDEFGIFQEFNADADYNEAANTYTLHLNGDIVSLAVNMLPGLLDDNLLTDLGFSTQQIVDIIVEMAAEGKYDYTMGKSPLPQISADLTIKLDANDNVKGLALNLKVAEQKIKLKEVESFDYNSLQWIKRTDEPTKYNCKVGSTTKTELPTYKDAAGVNQQVPEEFRFWYTDEDSVPAAFSTKGISASIKTALKKEGATGVWVYAQCDIIARTVNYVANSEKEFTIPAIELNVDLGLKFKDVSVNKLEDTTGYNEINLINAGIEGKVEFVKSPTSKDVYNYKLSANLNPLDFLYVDYKAGTPTEKTALKTALTNTIKNMGYLTLEITKAGATTPTFTAILNPSKSDNASFYIKEIITSGTEAYSVDIPDMILNIIELIQADLAKVPTASTGTEEPLDLFDTLLTFIGFIAINDDSITLDMEILDFAKDIIVDDAVDAQIDAIMAEINAMFGNTYTAINVTIDSVSLFNQAGTSAVALVKGDYTVMSMNTYAIITLLSTILG